MKEQETRLTLQEHDDDDDDDKYSQLMEGGVLTYAARRSKVDYSFVYILL